jgi:PmbA protein
MEIGKDKMRMAEMVVSQVSALGAEVEAYLQLGRETSIEVNRSKVNKLLQAETKGLGIRVLMDGREGYAYTSEFAKENIEEVGRSAFNLAQASDRDEYRALPDLEPIPDADLEIFDPLIEETPIEKKIDFAIHVEQAALDFDKRVSTTNRCTYIDRENYVALMNSKGFSGTYRNTLATAYLSAIARQGEETTSAMDLRASTFLDDLMPEEIGHEAAKKAVQLLGARPVPSQEATIVFSPFAAAEFILFLSLALTAEVMQKGRSFLLGKLGMEVGSKEATLIDDGRMKRGMRSAPFDDEGVVRQNTKLVDAGTLRSVLHNTYTARKDGAKSTGNAARESHREPPGLSTTNFYLEPGRQSSEEIISKVERGLYVQSTMATGGINPVSGDYSVAARGIWIEDGELTHPVNEVTIAASMDRMLMQISAVGNDLRFTPLRGVHGAPTVRIDGMTIGGR